MERRLRALVTGASSGIGLEISKVLAREGYDLVLVARRKDALEELRAAILQSFAVNVLVIAADLSRHDSADEISAKLRETGVETDVLVNNAGIGGFGPFEEGDPELFEGMISVNVSSLTRLTRMLLPGMIRRRAGRILNIASVAAFQPGPLMAVYYATKAYVLSLSEALAEELSGSGVTVTALCPGPTRSEFHERAGIPVGAAASARKIAEIGVRAMALGRRVVVPGGLFRLFVFVSRFLPRRSIAAVVHRTQRVRLRRRK